MGILWSLVIHLLGSFYAQASPEVDRVYGMRRIVPLVINQEQEPVFSEYVEDEMIRYLKTHSRFSFPKREYLEFKEKVSGIYLYDPKVATQDKLEWIRAQILELRAKEVDSVLIAEIYKSANQVRVSYVIGTTNDLEYVRTKEFTVENPYTMEGYKATVPFAFEAMLKEFPFDATVVQRDGYRVILDKGGFDIQKGQDVSAHTLEVKDGKLSMQETGIIRIIDPGEEISFGQIIVEKRPLEVTTLNKVVLTPIEADRSSAMETMRIFKKKEIGGADLAFGASLISVGNIDQLGQGYSDNDRLFPTGMLTGDIWLTSRLFATLNISFAFASLTGGSAAPATTLATSVSDLRLMAGYRASFGRSFYSPIVCFKGGFARHSVNVDPSLNPMSYSSTAHSGLVVGASTSFAIRERYSVGFDINAFLIPTFSEGPFQSGDEVKNLSGWEIGFRGEYHFNEAIDFFLRLQFQSYRAEFEGRGDRPVSTPIASVTQFSKGAYTGISYSF